MPLVPRKPQDDSPEEKERFERDTAAYKENPDLFSGQSGVPPKMAEIKPPPAGPLRPAGGDLLPKEQPPLAPVEDAEIVERQAATHAPPAETLAVQFQPLTDEELDNMTKAQLEIYAINLPNGQGFDPDRRFGKEKIIEQIKVRHENFNLHQQGG